MSAPRSPVGTTDEGLDVFIDRNDLAAGIVERLEAAASASASSWWWTGWWDLIRGHYGQEPLVVVLGALADTMRAGADPVDLVGDATATGAVRTAQAWQATGVKPSEVVCWLAAGCWRPAVARNLARAGVRPAHLLTRNGRPQPIMHWEAGRSVPLAVAVGDGTVTIEEAVAAIRARAMTYQVVVSWQGQRWRLEIESTAIIQVWRLAEVMDAAYELVERSHLGGGPIWIDASVQLPMGVRARLQLVERYNAEARDAQSDGERQAAACSAEAALCGAARELVAMGVAVDDVAVLLRVSAARVRELVAG